MENNKIHSDDISFTNFQWLGYFLGGMCPVILFIFMETAFNQNIISDDKEKLFLVLLLIGVPIGFAVYHFRSQANFKQLYHWLFAIQALFSFILIHILVLYTGGPVSSVFSISYLYLIAIVGYSCRPKKELYGAAILIGISFLTTLFFLKEQQLAINFLIPHITVPSAKISLEVSASLTNSNKFIYLFVFVIQGIVTTYIASKHTNEAEQH